jgi:hypothetical protein
MIQIRISNTAPDPETLMITCTNPEQIRIRKLDFATNI